MRQEDDDGKGETRREDHEQEPSSVPKHYATL
jgi:hypothetical protein